MEFLHKVEAVVLLGPEGERVLAQYYPTVDPNGGAKKDTVEVASHPWGTIDQQLRLEKEVFTKVRDPKRPHNHSMLDEVMLYDGHTVLFEEDGEMIFVIVGGPDENEIVLSNALSCVQESIQQVLRLSPGTMEKRTLLEHFHILLLVLDEVVDDGVILEISSAAVVPEVAPYAQETGAEGARKAFSNINKYLKQNL